MLWNDFTCNLTPHVLNSKTYKFALMHGLLSFLTVSFKDGAHYCYCANFLRMPRKSRGTRKKCATRRIHGLVLSPPSLGGSSYFLRKRWVVFQEVKNNFYLACQFFENPWSMRMLLFLPYCRFDQTFYSQTKLNSKTSKVIASRCYAWSLGIKQSLNR